jgi:hypothetical protein
MTNDHENYCNCYECQQNHFDFPSWADIKNKSTEILGYATGNPIAVMSAKTAQNTNASLREMQKKGLISPDKKINITAEDVAPGYNPDGSRQVEVELNLPPIFGKLKWLFIIGIAVVLIGVFIRVSGK